MPYHGNSHTKAENENHANQLNPNSEEYWQSRDYDERPDDWDERTNEKEEKAKGK